VIEMAADECMDIPLNEADMVSPLTSEMLQGSGVEDWEALSLSQRKALIEEVIQTDIRPYIELDAGGIQIVDLSETHQLTIAYQGSCTSCHSATGSTLQAIEQILRAKLFAALEVVPDLSFLKIDPL
jgi:NifU-like protein